MFLRCCTLSDRMGGRRASRGGLRNAREPECARERQTEGQTDGETGRHTERQRQTKILPFKILQLKNAPPKGNTKRETEYERDKDRDREKVGE